MKSISLTICIILSTFISGCGGGKAPEVPLGKSTNVEFSYEYNSSFAGKGTAKYRLSIATKRVQEPLIQIDLANKGEMKFSGEGDEFYQVDKDRSTISAIREDLLSWETGFGRTVFNDFDIDVGATKTVYLKLHPGAVSIDYRKKDSGNLKTMFSMATTQ